jgi:hypothetical protein
VPFHLTAILGEYIGNKTGFHHTESYGMAFSISKHQSKRRRTYIRLLKKKRVFWKNKTEGPQ